jgi:antitoxin (DNA-binding transcriptional repressor) of toxin-antitoxin stability system
VVKRVRGGERITVIYRSRPAFQIVPLDTALTTDRHFRQMGFRAVP